MGESSSRRLRRQKQQRSVGEQNGVVVQSPEICLQINTKPWRKVSSVIKTARLQLCGQTNTYLMGWMIFVENVIKQDLVHCWCGHPYKLESTACAPNFFKSQTSPMESAVQS